MSILQSAFELITNKYANSTSIPEKICDILLWPLRELRGQSPFVLINATEPPNCPPDAKQYFPRTIRVCQTVRRNFIFQIFLKITAILLSPISLLGIIPKGILGLMGSLGKSYEDFLGSPPAPNLIKFSKNPSSYLQRVDFRIGTSEVQESSIIMKGFFGECSCLESHNFDRFKTKRRQKIEEKIINHIKENFSTDQEIKYLSLGSGDLLQDYIIICKLISIGYKNISISLIDKIYSGQNTTPTIRIEIFKSLMKYYSESNGCNITVNTHPYMKSAKEAHVKADIVSAIDLDGAFYKSGPDLQRAQESLTEKGKFFLSYDLFDFIFNKDKLLKYNTYEPKTDTNILRDKFLPAEMKKDLESFIGSDKELHLYELSLNESHSEDANFYLKQILPTLIPKNTKKIILNLFFPPIITKDTDGKPYRLHLVEDPENPENSDDPIGAFYSSLTRYSESSVSWTLKMLYPNLEFHVKFFRNKEKIFSSIKNEPKCVVSLTAYGSAVDDPLLKEIYQHQTDNCFVLGSAYSELYPYETKQENKFGLLWDYNPANHKPTIFKKEGDLSTVIGKKSANIELNL